ncbi:MAG: hypothetical protein ACFE9J_12770 [Candidatus Hermodarchaeota archaeon]
MNILKKYLDETVRAIGYFTKFEYHSLISVKKIRKLYKIDPSDYSKINFYWRSLQSLEKDRIIQRYGTNSPKKYQVLNFMKFFDLLHDAYIDQVSISNNNQDKAKVSLAI